MNLPKVRIRWENQGVWRGNRMNFDSPSTSLGNYQGEQAKMVYQPKIKDRLELAVKQAESRLADAKRAKEIFDAHPELEELLNIMQKGSF